MENFPNEFRAKAYYIFLGGNTTLSKITLLKTIKDDKSENYFVNVPTTVLPTVSKTSRVKTCEALRSVRG